MSRFYGGSTDITMSTDGDVSIWGGWAQQYGTVSITEKFLLASNATSEPTVATSVSPSSSPTSLPSVFVEDASTFSVSFSVATTGVTSSELQQEVASLGSVFCTQLELDPSLCYITFVSASEGENDDLQFDLMVTDYPNEVNATNAITILQQYVADTTSEGFIEEFFAASTLRFDIAAYQSSEVTESGTQEGTVYAFSCSLSENLKLSWKVESQGDGVSTGEAGGYISGSLTMLSGGSTPWFASGLVQNDALLMVESPEHVVYFYEPNSQQAGMYKINDYASSGIVADTRIRADTGVLGKHSSQAETHVDFQQSRHTGIALVCAISLSFFMYLVVLGVSVDPVLAIDAGGDFNTIIWAHGGNLGFKIFATSYV